MKFEEQTEQEAFEQFFLGSPDLLCIVTTEGILLRLNPQWEKTFGFSISAMTGKRLPDFVHKEDVAPTVAAITAPPEAQVRNLMNRCRCSDGTYRWIDWRFTLVGKNILCASARDVTDSRRAETALRQANEKLNMLLSISRHDILNQLTALHAYHELIRQTTHNTETLAFLEKGKKVAEAIGRQIAFTRYYQDLGVHLPQWLDAGRLFDDAARQIDLPGITLINSNAGIDIFADPLIAKVLYNLIDNSVRHGERVTLITFTSQETPDGLILSYHDNGAGIRREDKPLLFRKGFGKQSGLGLFLSGEILSLTGMTIQENGEPGNGVLFEIFVPKGMYRRSCGTSPKDECTKDRFGS